MFQTSSSAIVSVTLKFIQDNSYTYITINTMILLNMEALFDFELIERSSIINNFEARNITIIVIILSG